MSLTLMHRRGVVVGSLLARSPAQNPTPGVLILAYRVSQLTRSKQ